MKKFLQAVSVMLTIFVWMLTPLLGQSTCETPTGINVFEITTNSAQVTWVNEDTVEMQWYVFVYPTNQGTAYGWETFTSTDTVTLTDLLPNTNYTVCVQTYCGEDTLGESLYSEWSNTYAFTTACGVISVTPENTYSIIFGNDDVHCWSWDTIAGNAEWYVGYNGYMFRNTQGGDSARLLSPFYDLTQMERPHISFYHFQDVTYDLSVYYRTDINAAWQLLGNYPNASWQTTQLRLPDVETCQISFVATNDENRYEDNGVMIYAMTVYEGPSCLVPVGLTEESEVVSPAANQATLSWTDVNDVRPASWTVSYRTPYNIGEVREVTVTDTFVTLDNLILQRYYSWKVKANCGEDDESNWSDEKSFFTNCGVYAVTPQDNYLLDFEDEANCWTMDGQGSFSYYVNPHAGSRSGVLYNASLTSPFFDLRQLEHPTLTFFYNQEYEYLDTLCVLYRTSETEQFQLLSKYTGRNEYSIGINTLNFDTCQIRFQTATNNYVYIDDILIGERPSCVMPSLLTVDTVTSESVTLSWNANGTETQWTVRIDGVRDTVVTTNPATIGGLQPATSYSAMVRANCSVSDTSEWSNPVSFTTECSTVTIDDENIFTEDFENCDYGTIPECWGILTESNSYYGNCPMTYNWSPFGSTNSFFMYVTSGNSNAFYMNELTNAINTMQVSFHVNNNQQDASMILEVGVMEDGDFVPVKTLRSIPQISYQRVLFNQYEGNGNRIAFRASTTSSFCYVILDDILVEQIPSCFVPEDVTVDGITTDSAVITWFTDTIQSPASWTVRLFDGYNYRDTTVTTDTVVFSDLASGTRYTVQVRANCNGTDTSDWSGEVYFNTDCDVYVVTPENPYVEGFEVFPVCWRGSGNWDGDYAHSGEYGVTTSNNLSTPVLDLTALENPTLTFFHKYSSMEVYYRTRESGFWMLLTDFAYSSDYEYASVSLPNPTETYQIAFSTGGTIYLDDIMVGDEPSCMTPSYVTLDSITDTSVKIAWTPNGSEASWTVRLNEEEIVVTENPVTINNLEPGMVYTVTVRANCSDSTVSDWSYERVFNTNCADVYVVTDNQPYHDGFENRICWWVRSFAGGEYWQVGDTINAGAEYAYEGSRFGISPYVANGQSLLFTPVLDITQVSYPQLSFQIKTDVESDTASDLMVLYRTSDTTEWQPLEIYHEVASAFTRIVVDLPQATGTYQIGFLAKTYGVQRFIIDDVNVYNMPPCAEPTNVTVENNVATWTGNAPSYNVKVSVGGVVVDEATVNTNSYTVRGLEEGDYAIIRVQAVCDEENLSDWTEGDVFVITGIESFGLNATVYPNPTTGVVNIEGATLNADIAVFDMFGKQMLAGKVTSERTELDLAGLTSGVYIIRIAMNGEVTTVKVVKE